MAPQKKIQQKASATTISRSIGRKLKAAREAKGLSEGDAAAFLRIHPRTIKRHESGVTKPQYSLTGSFCDLYGVDRATKARLLEMVDLAEQPEWFEEYRQDIQPWLVLLLDLEAIADRSFIYGTMIPGWLQTPDYAAALAERDSMFQADQDYARRLPEIRHKRAQNVVDRIDNQLSVIIDAAALAARIGSTEIMEDQLAHLVKADRKRNVSISYLPFKSGGRVDSKCAFTLLEFDDEESDIGYIEHVWGGQYNSRLHAVKHLKRLYEILGVQAQSIRECEA